MKPLALLLLTSAAFAGLSTTDGQVSYELHQMPSNAMVPGPWPISEADCIAKAKASIGKWACVTRRNFETVGTCDDVPQPAFPVKVNAEGYLEVPEIRVPVLANGTDWGPAEIQAMVPAPYPACWQIGWVLYTGQEYTTDIEGDPVMEPVCWGDECTVVPAP